MFLIFAFHVIRIHNSILAAAAALHFNQLHIIRSSLSVRMSYSFFYSLVATHYDTLNEKELDSHHDYLAQNLYKYHLKQHLKPYKHLFLASSLKFIAFVTLAGFEPALTEPKSVVLPLHHRAIKFRIHL